MVDMCGSEPLAGAERARALTLIEQQPMRDRALLVDWFDRLCRALSGDLGVAGAAITLTTGQSAGESVAAASDAGSRKLADLAFAIGEGPARDALTTGRPVLVHHLGSPPYGAWPGYTSAATDLGLCAVFCFPLQVGAVRFGVFSVFATQPTRLSSQALSRCLTMSELVTERLLDSSDEGRPGQIEPDLDNALGLHSEIYQAQGMVAVALRVTLKQALARMRGHAFHSDLRLLEVAVDIVEGRLSLPDDRSTS